MNIVEPIKDIKTVIEIGNYLKEKSERNYIMYLIGIYSGLRISDILNLKLQDIAYIDNRIKNNINIREKKTGKQRSFQINPYLKKELKKYIDSLSLDNEDYIIYSRVPGKPLSRQMAYYILNDVGARFGLDSFGCHTLRKTMGMHFYRQTKDIVTLQKIFNHADPSVTLRYIGIDQETIDEKMCKLKLF